MTPLALALREATNADWTSAFVLPAAAPVPWAAVPAWDASAQYGAGGVVQLAGTLYVAAVSAPTLGSFQASEWTAIGIAAPDGVAYDLTGADLRMYVVDVDDAGAPLPGQIRLRLSSAAGTLVAVPAQRRVTLALPAAKANAIPAGTYYADVLAAKGGTLTRIAAGTVAVDQGVTR